MATTRRSSTTRTAHSRCQVANPPGKEGAYLHEARPTWLCALCLRPGHYRVSDRCTASRTPGLPGLAWLLSKGGRAMQQLFPTERLLLLDRVQVTYSSLRQAHARLGASLVLFEQVAAVRSKYCKQALKTVRDMGKLAASLHAFLLTLDSPPSL